MKPTRMDRLDLISAIILILFAAGALFESLRMDRLEDRNVDPYTAPGLVPGLISCLLLLCGIVLLIRSLSRGGWRIRFSVMAIAGLAQSQAARRVVLTLLLTLVFTLGLFGRLTFSYAASIFIFVFIVLMDSRRVTTLPARFKAYALALSIAVVAGFSIEFVFTQVFIVKLP